MSQHDKASSHVPKKDIPCKYWTEGGHCFRGDTCFFRHNPDERAPQTVNKAPGKIKTPWHCSVCNIYTASEEHLRSHKAGKKHNERLESLNLYDDRKPVASKGPNSDGWHYKQRTTQGRTKENNDAICTMYYCKACDTYLDSKASLEEHRVSTSHLETLGANRCGGAPTSAASEGLNSMAGIQWRCSLCGVTATCQQNLQQHFQGKIHAAALARQGIVASKSTATTSQPVMMQQQGAPQHPDTAAPSRKPQTNKGGLHKVPFQFRMFYCPVCDSYSTCQKNFDMHMKGAPHKQKAAELGLCDGPLPKAFDETDADSAAYLRLLSIAEKGNSGAPPYPDSSAAYHDSSVGYHNGGAPEQYVVGGLWQDPQVHTAISPATPEGSDSISAPSVAPHGGQWSLVDGTAGQGGQWSGVAGPPVAEHSLVCGWDGRQSICCGLLS